MGVGFQDSIDAFDELLDVHGECLEFRGAALRAVVKWELTPAELDRAQVNLRERNATLIEFHKCSVTPPPRAGEFMRDQDGNCHDVKVVQRTDATYRCYCGVGEKPEE